MPDASGPAWRRRYRWDTLRCLELLLDAGYRPTVYHNVVPPAFLQRGSAPLPVLDPFDFHPPATDARYA
jgi:hypothetical protein